MRYDFLTIYYHSGILNSELLLIQKSPDNSVK